FVGVGNLDFLVDASRAFLVGGSAKLRSGFRLWERVAGTSAVSWQLAALEGGRDLPERKPQPAWAQALSLRIQAEDPILGLPHQGRVHEVSKKRQWKIAGAQAELDLAVEAGQDVAPEGSSLIGVLWAGGAERKQAIAAAEMALKETWIGGTLQTNER